MNCPECEGKTAVAISKKVEMLVARQRVCLKCGYIFYTEEVEVEGADALKYYWSTTKARQRGKSK